MNNRIKELARCAGALPTQNCGVPQWYMDEDVFEKFAESIVKECLYTIQLAVVRNGTTPENQRTHKHLNDIAEKFDITFPI